MFKLFSNFKIMIRFFALIRDKIGNTYNRIPNIWKNTYFLICLWYLIIFAISAFFEWRTFEAYNYDVYWKALYTFEALCIAIIIIFIWTRWLVNFSIIFQIIGHIIGLLLFSLSMQSLYYYFEMYVDGFTALVDWQEYMIDLLAWDAMRFYDQYIIAAAVFYIIRYFETIQRKEHEQSELIIKNKEMQLSLLKSQINPHFLFNTLNSISMLISTSKVKARKVITQLSDIFRYALDSYGGHTVKLSQELEFIENYIKIQQVRFEDRLKYVKSVDEECLNLDLPPMILQPLIENAVKYGVAPKDDGGEIKLTIKTLNNSIFFEVKDNGLGINAKKVLDSESSGIGLDNTEKRLKNYFGQGTKLMIDSTFSGYTVSFRIPKNKRRSNIIGPKEMTNLIEEK